MRIRLALQITAIFDGMMACWNKSSWHQNLSPSSFEKNVVGVVFRCGRFICYCVVAKFFLFCSFFFLCFFYFHRFWGAHLLCNICWWAVCILLKGKKNYATRECDFAVWVLPQVPVPTVRASGPPHASGLYRGESIPLVILGTFLDFQTKPRILSQRQGKTLSRKKHAFQKN